MCMCRGLSEGMRPWVQMPTGARGIRFHGAGIMRCLMWVLGTTLGSSASTELDLSWWVVSPAPIHHSFKKNSCVCINKVLRHDPWCVLHNSWGHVQDCYEQCLLGYAFITGVQPWKCWAETHVIRAIKCVNKAMLGTIISIHKRKSRRNSVRVTVKTRHLLCRWEFSTHNRKRMWTCQTWGMESVPLPNRKWHKP